MSGTRMWAVRTTAGVYAVGLGANTVVLPLVAVDAGYSGSEIGILTAASAAAQILIRVVFGAIMRRWPDRVLVTGASVLLALSFLALEVSTGWVAFLLGHAAQGASRACFWTGIQSHVVRDKTSLTQDLARITLVANTGLLVGPLIAGFLVQWSPSLALGVGTAVGIAATALSVAMRRLPPFRPSALPRRTSLLSRPPVIAGCIAAGLAGFWRGLLTAYVPVVLTDAGQTAGTVGALVALASTANTASAAFLARFRVTRAKRALVLCCLAAAVGSGLLGLLAFSLPAVALCLVVSGFGAGILQIMGASVATEAVHREERGQTIALAGTIRAAAMLVSPLVVAALLPVAGMATSLGLAGLAMTLPAVVVRRWRAGSEATESGDEIPQPAGETRPPRP